MRVRMLKTMAGPAGVRQEHLVYGVGDEEGAGLVKAGIAVAVSEVLAAAVSVAAAADGDLQGEVGALREENETLKGRVAELEAELAALTAGAGDAEDEGDTEPEDGEGTPAQQPDDEAATAPGAPEAATAAPQRWPASRRRKG